MDRLVIENLVLQQDPARGYGPGSSKNTVVLSGDFHLGRDPNRNLADAYPRMTADLLCKRIMSWYDSAAETTPHPLAEHLATQVLLDCEEICRVDLKLVAPFEDESAVMAGVSIDRRWHRAYLGVGSNLGDRIRHLRDAVDLINATRLTQVVRMSKIYETEPFGYLDQEMFLNGCLEVKTLLGPRSLIRRLLEIETRLKRERTIPNGPRTIDLDILFYDDLITPFEEAVIPHPRLHERPFVLVPLCDIARYHMHPVLGRRCCQLLCDLNLKDDDLPVEWAGASLT